MPNGYTVPRHVSLTVGVACGPPDQRANTLHNTLHMIASHDGREGCRAQRTPPEGPGETRITGLGYSNIAQTRTH